MSSRRLQGMTSRRLQDMSSRYLQDMSLRRLQDMSSRHLQNMSSRRLQDMSSRRLQDVFSVKIFRLPRRLQDLLQEVFKTSSRCLGRRKIIMLKTSWKRLQDVLKTCSRPTNVCWEYASAVYKVNCFLTFAICENTLDVWNNLIL